ncbi:MAG: hypothetical protein WC841_05845 [Candidatus Shapirobacteria bacterium]|jgi:hypothetical protein
MGKFIIKIWSIFCLIIFWVYFCLSPVSAAIYERVNFQGKVVNKSVGETDGTNVPDGDYDFVFTIYPALSTGSSLWTETWDSGTAQVAVTSGVFNVNLGTQLTFPANLFESDSLFLAINFNADGDMTPRIRLTSVPYAFSAGKVAGLTIDSIGVTLDQSLATTNSPTFSGLNIGTSLSVAANVNVGGTLIFSATGVNIDAVTAQGLIFQGRNSSSFNTTSGDITLNPAGSVIIGTGTSTFTFNPLSGPLYSGSARPSKTIRISPEYPGASMTADGSTDIGGTMTSDNTLNAGGIGWKNYYQWSSGNAALQDYSVLARVALPSDFDTWETGSCPGAACAFEIEFQTGVGTTDDNYISVAVNNNSDTPGTAVCSIGSTAATAWTLTGCPEATLNDGSSSEWDAAGEAAVVRIKLAAKSTENALSRVGDIILRYKAKF